MDKRKRLKEIQKEIHRNLKTEKGARLIELNAPLHEEYSRLLDELLEGNKK